MTMEASFFGLADKKAMIIGGGQGMGESTSRILARAGCDVAVIDIDRERAERVAGSVNGLGRRGVPIIGDVLDDAQIPDIVATGWHRRDGVYCGSCRLGYLAGHDSGNLGPAVAPEPALFLPVREGSGSGDDQSPHSGGDPLYCLG